MFTAIRTKLSTALLLRIRVKHVRKNYSLDLKVSAQTLTGEYYEVTSEVIDLKLHFDSSKLPKTPGVYSIDNLSLILLTER